MEVSRTSLLLRRIGAYTIDMVVIILAFLGLGVANLNLGWFFPEYLYLLYFLAFEWLCGGRTIGKLVFRICVINNAGEPPTFLQAFIRSITRHLEVFLGIVTFFILVQSERFQRVGDMLARTYVIPTKDLAQLRISAQRDVPEQV